MDDRENSMPVLVIDEDAPASAPCSSSAEMEEWYSRLAVHVKKKVECEVCGKMYASKKSLKIHNRIHTGFKPYQCTMCGKRFTQCNVLHAHLNAHTGTRNWKCAICNKAFTQSAHLRTHEKTHYGSKDYRCEHCGRCFSSKGVRDRHKRQHTGEKPFKCGQCNKSFTRGESLKFHENAHDGIRPYTCRYDLCLSSFTKKSSLKRHIDTCHRRLRRPHSESVSVKSEAGTSLEDSGPEDSNEVEAADQLFHLAVQRVFELPLDEIERILTSKGPNSTSLGTADREVLENELELARWDMPDSPSEASFDSGYFAPAGTPSPTFSHSSMPTMGTNGFAWPISDAGLGFSFPKLEIFKHEMQMGDGVENLAMSILNSTAPSGGSSMDAVQPYVHISRLSLAGPMPIRIKEEPIDSINPFWMTDSANQNLITSRHNPAPSTFHSEHAFRQAMFSHHQPSTSANVTSYPTMAKTCPSMLSFSSANYAPKPNHTANQAMNPRNGFCGMNGFYGETWMETNERKPRMF
ncbi:hypothetical protein RvY_06777-2 [Ramazzottius varieornatus]|uniref:C2H2-type domain-containing protein n=1 Tax=Ramazzottius varieornatus TaxID=947166 RepID=A0A1D1V2L0_RAMVA|nr:hypothetical protein RvY_06777-2 [Ramazzottius varieornatus]